MPSPLHIRIHSLRTIFGNQWSEEMRDALAPIVRSFMFSFLATVFVCSLCIQGITGILLSLHYSPTSTPTLTADGKPATIVKKNKVILDQEGDTLAIPGEIVLREAKRNEPNPGMSYLSTISIQTRSSTAIIRGIHQINTHLLLASLLCLMLLLIIHLRETRLFKGIWLVLLSLGIFVTLIAWTGYVLPWDTFSSTSYMIVTGFIEQGLPESAGIAITSFLGKHQSDSIARLFALHGIFFPFITISLLWFVHSLLKPLIVWSNSSIRYAIMIAIVLCGLLFINSNPLLSPSDARIPTIINIQPAWFFQPLHGVVHSLPADGGMVLIGLAIFSAFALPFISSYAIRMIVLGILSLGALYFGIAH